MRKRKGCVKEDLQTRKERFAEKEGPGVQARACCFGAVDECLILTFHAFLSARRCAGSIALCPVAAPEGRSRVGFSLYEAAERRRRESEGSRRRRRRDERRRREGRGAIGAEGGPKSILVHFAIKI